MIYLFDAIALTILLSLFGAASTIWLGLVYGGPYLREITRRGGEDYLSRWSIRKQAQKAGAWRAYLHSFHSPDDEGHHNHPWKWSLSIVLWGSYTEQRFELTPCPENLGPECKACAKRHIDERRVRWFNLLRESTYHRISELHPRCGKVLTLFITGPFSGRSWGFWIPGRGHVHWKVRQAENTAALLRAHDLESAAYFGPESS